MHSLIHLIALLFISLLLWCFALDCRGGGIGKKWKIIVSCFPEGFFGEYQCNIAWGFTPLIFVDTTPATWASCCSRIYVVLVVGWPMILLNGFAIMMASHVAWIGPPWQMKNGLSWCLHWGQINRYYPWMLSIGEHINWHNQFVDNLWVFLRAIDVYCLTNVYLCVVTRVDTCNTRQQFLLSLADNHESH